MKTQQPNISQVFTDYEELERRFNFPIKPQQVQWQVVSLHQDETPLPGGQYILTALLSFTPQDFEQWKQIKEFSLREQPSVSYKLALQDWIPQEVVNGVTPMADNDQIVQLPVAGYDAQILHKSGTGWKPIYWISVRDKPQIMLFAFSSN